MSAGAIVLGCIVAVDLAGPLREAWKAQDIPGVSVSVVSRPGCNASAASGFADIKTHVPLDEDSRFYVGSLSKIFTAVLTMTLVEDGTISLDDTVDFIANGEHGITIEHLLSHASGLPREGDFGYWFSGEFPDDDALVDYLTDVELRFAPGTDIHYSNVGYAALGRVIEQVTGQTFATALKERVLAPLGMHDSGIEPHPDVVNGYTPPGRIVPSAERPFAGVGEKVGSRHVRMYHDARAMSPAFGIYSSAADMAVLAGFLIGHAGDDVLSQQAREQMRTRQASGWGLGLKVQRHRGKTINRHDGWFAAHRAHILIDADNGIAVTVLTNADDADPGAITDALYKVLLSTSKRR
ncbi:MAG: serine hydrolase domain-containing protein [Woeseiaceae bacterium]|nr:serine hydrolase domain-containing protein [Woeseiaceae bacterium]